MTVLASHHINYGFAGAKRVMFLWEIANPFSTARARIFDTKLPSTARARVFDTKLPRLKPAIRID
jgi:hypothetical protein